MASRRGWRKGRNLLPHTISHVMYEKLMKKGASRFYRYGREEKRKRPETHREKEENPNDQKPICLALLTCPDNNSEESKKPCGPLVTPGCATRNAPHGGHEVTREKAGPWGEKSCNFF